MAEKPKTLLIVQVDWTDADTATAVWEKRDHVAAEKVKIVHTWGVVISDDDERLVIVGDYDPTADNVNGGSIIPKKMIKRIKRLGTWKA